MKYVIDTDLMTVKVFDATAPEAPAAPAVPEGFVFMPKTGHTLPKPKDEQVSFWGYMIASWKEAGGSPGSQSPYAASAAFTEYSTATGKSHIDIAADRSLWPEVLDRYYNVSKYQTPEELAAAAAAAAAAQAEWDAHWEAKKNNRPTPREPAITGPTQPPVDKDPPPASGDTPVPIE